MESSIKAIYNDIVLQTNMKFGLHMWQSRIENGHYSISMKIEFRTCINALDHYLCGS